MQFECHNSILNVCFHFRAVLAILKRGFSGCDIFDEFGVFRGFGGFSRFSGFGGFDGFDGFIF